VISLCQMEFELANKKCIELSLIEDGRWSVNSEEVDAELTKVSEGSYHLLKDGVGYRVVVEQHDPESKVLVLRINGERLELRAKDKYESLLASLGMNKLTSTKAKDLKAPMPGLVVEIPVTVGQEVNAGDTLLVLEAMKMENVIKAEASGTVKEILVLSSDSVEKGQVLVSFES